MKYIVEYSSLIIDGDAIRIVATLKEYESGLYCAHFYKEAHPPAWILRVLFRRKFSTRLISAKNEIDRTVKAYINTKNKELVVLNGINEIISTGTIVGTAVIKSKWN